MALQALADYAVLSYAGSVNLTVSLASTNLDYQETFELHAANQKLLQTAAVCIPGPGLGGQCWRPLPPACHTPLCVCRGCHGVFSLQIPSLPTGLFVSAKGEGCCLMQVGLQGGRSGTRWGFWNLGTPRGAGWELQAQWRARLSGMEVCG